MTDSPILALIQQQMEEAVEVQRRILDQALFRSEAPPLFWRIAYPPVPWWRRWGQRAGRYLTTLWQAVKGEDPYGEETDW